MVTLNSVATYADIPGGATVGDVYTVQDPIGINGYDQFDLGVGVQWGICPIPNSATTPQLFGYAISSVGTGTAAGNPANGSGQARTVHWKARVGTAATSAIASYRGNTATMVIGDGSGLGGFRCRLTAGPDTGVSTSSTGRFFMGLRGSASAPTDVNPSSLTNIIGLGYDQNDANVQIMTNDNTGTATKVSTGWARPTTDSTAMYTLDLLAEATDSNVHYVATDLSTGLQVRGTITTDLPSTSTYLAVQMYHSVGGTSSVTGLAVGPCAGRHGMPLI